MPCQGSLDGLVQLQTRTKPCGIRAHINTAQPGKSELTVHWCACDASPASRGRVERVIDRRDGLFGQGSVNSLHWILSPAAIASRGDDFQDTSLTAVRDEIRRTLRRHAICG